MCLVTFLCLPFLRRSFLFSRLIFDNLVKTKKKNKEELQLSSQEGGACGYQY
jgi:hypothetical protein